MPDTHLIAPFHLDQLAALTNGTRVEECTPRTSTMAQQDHKQPPAEGSTDKPNRPSHKALMTSTVIPSPMQSSADAGLLALGRDLETAWAAERVITGNEAATTEDIDAAIAPAEAIVDKILATPATTLEGLTVKARAVLWCGHDEHEAGPQLFDGDTTDIRLAGSIIADLIKAGAAGSTGNAHPDAALLEAWRGYVAGYRALDASGLEEDEERDRFYCAHIDPHRDMIEQTNARTVVGFAVQLRYLFAKYMECRDSENHALFNEPITEDLAATLDQDYRDHMLWRMAEAATRAAAGAGHPLFPADDTAEQAEHDPAQRHNLPQQPDELTTAARAVLAYNDAVTRLKTAATRPDIRGEFAAMLRRDAQELERPAEGAADPFGAAVAEFEQAAPSILPAVPSAVMVEAGAAAAGIDATAVRALYAAMAQAHQRSAAA